MPILDKSFATLTAVWPFVDLPSGGASTTVSTAAVAGATSLVIASGTNTANGDDIRIGTGETMELARISAGGGTTTLTLSKPLLFDHAVGEAVVEQGALNIGVPEAEGFNFSYAAETSDVFSATQRLAYGALNGYVDVRASWRYPVVTADVMALAFGIPRANVIGDGTAAAQTGTVGPRLFTSDGVLFGAITNVNVVAVGTLQDGSPVRLELYNFNIDPTGVNVSFARGQLTTVPVSGLASSGAIHYDGANWVPANVISTQASSKADIFSEITNVQTLTDSGTSNTLSAGVAAGVYSVTLTSAVGFTANNWVRIGSEYHFVHSIATNTLNLRTQVLAAQATGTAVVQQTRTTIGGVTGGFTMANSGSVTVQRSELFRTSLGLKIGNVATAFNFRVNSITPENLMLALGIPASAYANSRLPLGARIAADSAKTLLFTGLTQGGRTVTVCGWNGAAVVGGESVFTQSAAAEVPMSFKPAALQVFVNP